MDLCTTWFLSASTRMLVLATTRVFEQCCVCWSPRTVTTWTFLHIAHYLVHWSHISFPELKLALPHSNRSKQSEVRKENYSLYMMWNISGFKRGTSWPKNWTVKGCIVRISICSPSLDLRQSLPSITYRRHPRPVEPFRTAWCCLSRKSFGCSVVVDWIGAIARDYRKPEAQEKRQRILREARLVAMLARDFNGGNCIWFTTEMWSYMRRNNAESSSHDVSKPRTRRRIKGHFSGTSMRPLKVLESGYWCVRCRLSHQTNSTRMPTIGEGVLYRSLICEWVRYPFALPMLRSFVQSILNCHSGTIYEKRVTFSCQIWSSCGRSWGVWAIRSWGLLIQCG